MDKNPLKFSPLSLGPLPVNEIGKILNIPLADGVVHFSIVAQYHSYKQHGRDFLACMPYLDNAIANPTYVGQAPKHKNSGFEIIFTSTGANFNVLIAVRLKCDNRGRYQLNSVYPVDSNKIHNRLRKGFITKIAPTIKGQG